MTWEHRQSTFLQIHISALILGEKLSLKDSLDDTHEAFSTANFRHHTTISGQLTREFRGR